MRVVSAMCLAAISMAGASPAHVGAQDRPSTSGTIQVAGAELPYLVEGSGTSCLVYGSPIYYPRTFSARFKSALRCAHVADRGFLSGATRREGAPFAVPEAVEDIEAARKALGLDHVVLVGHSIHGLVVLAYAVKYPGHVSHVVAIGAPPTWPSPADSIEAYRTRTFGAARRAQHDAHLRALDSLVAAHPGRGIVANYIANGALYWDDPSFDSTPLWEGVDVNEKLISDLLGTPFAWNVGPSVVSVPAFIALGAGDFVVPPELVERGPDALRGPDRQRLRARRHTPSSESADEFDARVLRWLSRPAPVAEATLREADDQTRSLPMKLMIRWEIHPDRRTDVLSGFAGMELSDYQTQQGPAIKVLGRWHDIINMTGVAICETDDAEALGLWLAQWHAVCDFDIATVLDDEEAHAAARKVVAASLSDPIPRLRRGDYLMKRMAVFSALLLLACGSKETPPAPTAPDRQAQIQEANDVLLNRGEVERVLDFFAPTYVGHATAEDMSDPSSIAGFVTALRTAFPDLRVEVEVLVAQGDRVTWLRTHHGTQQGDFMGIPASGGPIVWQEMVVTRYEGELIAEEWGVSDMVERMQAK